ncbi:MAG: PKD domain-containing protein [Dehalococcoidia bacterium]
MRRSLQTRAACRTRPSIIPPTRHSSTLALLILSVLFAGRARNPGWAVAQTGRALEVSLTASPSMVQAGQPLTLTYSVDPALLGGSVSSLRIDYGDGTSDDQLPKPPGQAVFGSVSHVYSRPGTYRVLLTASDTSGPTGQTSVTVTVGGPTRAVEVNLSASTPHGEAGRPVSFSYDATPSSPDAQIERVSIRFDDGASSPLSTAGGTVQHTYDRPGDYRVTLVATDSNDQQGSADVIVSVDQPPAPPSLSLDAMPESVQMGQPVSFAYTVAANGADVTIANLLLDFGDGQTQMLPNVSAGGTVQHIYMTADSYTAILVATDSSGQSSAGAATVTVTRQLQAPTATPTVSPPTAQATAAVVAAQVSPPGVNVSPSSAVLPAGQPLSLSYSVATFSPGAQIQRVTVAWGDGTSESLAVAGGVTAHAYDQPGSYTITLTAGDSTNQRTQQSIRIVVTPPAVAGQAAANVPTVNPSAANAGPSRPETTTSGEGLKVSYPAGWNLVSGPEGTMPRNVAAGPFTFRSTDTAYESLPTRSALQPGAGYWVYFSTATTLTLPFTGPQRLTIQLQAGDVRLIGNPGTAPATLGGSGFSALIWDPVSSSYRSVASLLPGQGAWVESADGGSVTIANARE